MPHGLILVDDHVAIAQALASAFRANGFDPVEALPVSAQDVDGVLDAARRLHPAVALVDLNLGDDRSGLPLIAPLVGAGVQVVAFTARDDELALAESIEAGAAGFLNKGEPFETITGCVRRVAEGGPMLPVSRRAELLDLLRRIRAEGDERIALFRSLSPREREVLADLIEGRSAKQIAVGRGLAVKTVRHQIEAIRDKLGVHSQLAAVALAREVGWRMK
ncbi:MAG: LuxR C-terminal-related transcriptional regulator [Acidimicrobiales bacterium]